MKLLLFFFLFVFSFFADFADVCGYYYGEKDDFATEIKLYDDSTFTYSARREFPFEVSEGNWTLKGDTVVLTSVACKNPEALEHVPIRTYKAFTGEKYFYKKNSLTPVSNHKLIKSEILLKEK